MGIVSTLTNRPSRAKGYFFALTVVAVATGLQSLVWPFIPPSPHLLYYPAIVLVAWRAGFRPGLFAVLLSSIAMAYLFLLPVGIAIDAPADALDLGIFASVATGMSALIERLRHEAERARRSEAYARAVVELAPEPVFVAANRASKTWSEVNESGCRLLGIAGEAHGDRPIDASWSGLLEALGPGEVAHGEATVVDARGANVSVEVSGTVLPDGRLLAFVRDTRAQKQAEAERERALDRLRTVIDQSPVALVLALGPDGATLEANHFASELLGEASSGRLAPGYEARLVDPSGKPLLASQKPIARVLGGGTVEGEEFALRVRGRLVPVLLNAAPLHAPSGAVDGVVIALQDIRPMKELDRLRAEWNSVVAHDLMQPLSTIGLSAQLIAQSAGMPAGIDEPLARLARAAKRLSRMVRDLLDLSRLEVGKMPLLRRPTDLGELVRRVSGEIGMAPGAAERAIRIVCPRPLPCVDADADRVSQILENLLTNAVKYGAPDTPIDVALGVREGFAVVDVTNRGKGLTAAELPALFLRFSRTERARHGTVRGTGLGLHIARELAEAHGGRLTVASIPDEATTFSLHLPLAENLET